MGRIDAGTGAGTGTGDITLTTGGAITDNTGGEGTGNENLVGDTISLTAATGLNIAAAVSGGTGITHSAHGNVTSGGTLTATAAANDISMAAGTVYSTGGDLSLDAVGLLNVAAAVSGSRVELSDGTGIARTAAGDVTSDSTITATAKTGDIGMADVTVYSAGGAVSLTAGNNVASGRVEVGANPISVTAGTGSISGNNSAVKADGSEEKNLVGGAITLQAATSIGKPGTADIDTRVTSIDAQTTAGGIYLAETDAVTLGSTTGIRSAADTDIAVTTDGEMTVGAGGVHTFGSGDVRLTTTGGDLVVDGEVATDSGDLELAATGSIRHAEQSPLRAKSDNQGAPALRGGLLRTRIDNQGTLALRSGRAIGTMDAPITDRCGYPGRGRRRWRFVPAADRRRSGQPGDRDHHWGQSSDRYHSPRG